MKRVSFVSVTQSFNTASSMGRLTLNVLPSFAQFEREVTGERIRDKIAASKAKGMWMGGTLMLGYDAPPPGSRTLQVDEPEAVTVRHIFSRYLALGSVWVGRRADDFAAAVESIPCFNEINSLLRCVGKFDPPDFVGRRNSDHLVPLPVSVFRSIWPISAAEFRISL